MIYNRKIRASTTNNYQLTLLARKHQQKRQRKYCNFRDVFERKVYFYLFSVVVFLPIQFATIGVSATVGGNLIGEAALCAA